MLTLHGSCVWVIFKGAGGNSFSESSETTTGHCIINSVV